MTKLGRSRDVTLLGRCRRQDLVKLGWVARLGRIRGRRPVRPEPTAGLVAPPRSLAGALRGPRSSSCSVREHYTLRDPRSTSFSVQERYRSFA